MSEHNTPISGSQSVHLGRFVSYPKPQFEFTFDVFLRKRRLSKSERNRAHGLILQHPSERSYLDHEELGQYTGARKKDLANCIAFFESHGFTIVENIKEERLLLVKGNVMHFESAFGTSLGIYQGINQKYHLGYKGILRAPHKVAKAIDQIIGLTLPVKIESRKPTKPQSSEGQDAWDSGISLAQLSEAYCFPKEATGKGQCIGLVELGGKYGPSDFRKFFKLIGKKAPKVTIVGDLPKQDYPAANSEVTLDMQVAGALAPDAKIVIYYAHTLMDALKLIVRDKKNKPSTVSISWAGAENYYKPAERKTFDILLQEAALLGITIFAASGDYGAYNRLPNPQVSMPAAHPYILGVGGTMVTLDDGKIKDEVVWNEYHGNQASGGGYSVQYAMPDYQSQSVAEIYGNQHGRAVPDISAHAGTKEGYQVFFENAKTLIGGTSASTPLWAALVACMNEKLGYNLGFLNNVLYQLTGSIGFNPVLKGNNQVYSAGPYWNPCTGLGTPNGQHLLELIQAQASQIKEKDPTNH